MIFEFDCKKNQIISGIAKHLRTNLFSENTPNRFELGIPWKILVDFPDRRLNALYVSDEFLMERWTCYSKCTFALQDYDTVTLNSTCLLSQSSADLAVT